MLDEGKLEDKEIFCFVLNFQGKYLITSHWRAVPIKNNWHNYGQCLTTPSCTYINNHFAIIYSAILRLNCPSPREMIPRCPEI